MIVIDCDKEYSIENISTKETKLLSGIEYAKYLRRVNKTTESILFISDYTINEILNLPNSSILTAIGHHFIQKPFNKNQFNENDVNLKALNEIQLKDIIHNFCQPRSSVRESFHAFKGRLKKIKGKTISDKEKDTLFKIEFQNYEEELKKDVGNYPEIIREYKRIITRYDSKDIRTIEHVDSVEDGNFVSYLPADDDSTEETISERNSWKILFLDDEPEALKPVFEILDKKQINYIVATSCLEAKEIIRVDEKNEITVVVSDYRLCETNTPGWSKPKMQPEQGYDFLMYLAKLNRYNAMIALSGLSKWFLMDSFRQYQINVKVYSKNSLNAGGAKSLVDDMEYLGNKMNETILSLPTSTEWKKQLLPYYQWLRLECTDPENVELFIHSKAEEIIHQLDKQLELRSKISGIEERAKYLRILDSIGRATENLPVEFDNSKIDLFKIKLIYRRVLIYYLIKGTIPLNIVAKILNLGSADAIVKDNKGKISEEQDYKGMKKQVFSIQGLSESDIPFNILIEEKLWLKHKMGIEIINAQFSINQFYELLQFFYQVIKQQYPRMKGLADFENVFTSGKSTVAINKDLNILLKQLKATDVKLFDDFVNKLEKVVYEIRGYIVPLDSFAIIETTLINSQK